MSKQQQINAIRGMNDILPQDSALWLSVESVCRQVFEQHNYHHIRTPIVESTSLFARSIGDDTDIVAKEMYTFEDRNGDSLTLRPEGTASCVRAGIENGLFYNQQQRLWYLGQMFRHERPQKGRYRQFHQIGAEAYGWSTPDIEAEMLSIIQHIFQQLGLTKTNLQINSLGDTESRAQYRTALVDYLEGYKNDLDEDSQRRLTTNPLRILDSKNPVVQALLENAPSILDFLSETSTEHFSRLQALLSALNVPFTVNEKLVRGLDYYNDTVFEWVNEDFGAQSTVCAGGRYDGMVAQLGGQETPGFGFAMGLERLIQILQEQQVDITQHINNVDVFIVSIGQDARMQALALQQALVGSQISVQCHCGDGSMKNQFKRADKSGAKLAVIIGEAESQANEVSIKPLRSRSTDKKAEAGVQEQFTTSQNDAVEAVTKFLKQL